MADSAKKNAKKRANKSKFSTKFSDDEVVELLGGMMVGERAAIKAGGNSRDYLDGLKTSDLGRLAALCARLMVPHADRDGEFLMIIGGLDQPTCYMFDDLKRFHKKALKRYLAQIRRDNPTVDLEDRALFERFHDYNEFYMTCSFKERLMNPRHSEVQEWVHTQFTSMEQTIVNIMHVMEERKAKHAINHLKEFLRTLWEEAKVMPHICVDLDEHTEFTLKSTSMDNLVMQDSKGRAYGSYLHGFFSMIFVDEI